MLGSGETVYASVGLREERVAFAGRVVLRVLLGRSDPSPPRRRWRVPAGAVPVRERESATSLERLLGCPFAWVLRHTAGIRPGALRAIPDGARLLGTLAHAVIAALLTERSDWPPDEAEWVGWFNNRRLLEPIGNIPPAAVEARYYAQTEGVAMAA